MRLREKIEKKIAKETESTQKEVRDVLRTQFDVLRDIMRDEEKLTSIYFPGLGMFMHMENKIKLLKEKKERKKNNKSITEAENEEPLEF